MATSRKRNVEIQVLVDDKQARAQLKNIDGGLGQTQKGFGSLAGAMAAAGGAFVANHAVDALKEVLGASSDLNESINAVEKTFGPAADGILDLGKKAADAFGMSNSEFNAFAVGFAAFAENIGGASGRSVVDVIDEMATRISDFASVMNLDLSEATDKFRSGLAGETEPLRQFGIDVSAAAVQTKALELGLGDASGKLSEQEKVLARYELIMDQTDKTAGDFQDTSDELANSQRILAANIEDTKAKIGDMFVPAAEEATGAVSDLVSIIDILIDKSTELGGGDSGGGAIMSVVDGLISMIPFVGQAKAGWDSAVVVWDEAARALEETEGAEKEVTSATAELSRQMDIGRHSTKDAADAVRDFTDASKEAADPLFGLWKSTQRVREAQRAYTEAVIRHGQKSPQATQAALDLAEAQGELQGAAARFAEEGGKKSVDALRELARRAGLSEDAIDALIDQINRLNNTPIGRNRSRLPGGPGGDLEFHSGGVVPGTPGSEVNATLLAGETVLPRGAASGGGGDTHITIELDGKVIADVVRKHNAQYDRRNGR